MTAIVAELCQKFGGRFLKFETEMPTTQAAATVLQCDERSVIKTCIVKSKNVFSAVILQGTDRIDQKKLQAVVGKFSFAKPDEVVASTGYPAGGVPPFGFSEKIEQVVIDRNVFSHQIVYGGGGSKETLVQIAPKMIQTINEASKIAIRIEDIRSS